MKNIVLRFNLFHLVLAAAIFSSLILASVMSAYGQTTTFAQFIEQNGTQDVTFTNATTSGNLSTGVTGSAIAFKYSNIVGINSALTGFQDAHMFVTATTTTPGVVASGLVSLPLDQTVTVSIIRDTPAPVGVGVGSRTNLLTAVFTPAATTPTINGTDGGNSASLSTSTPDHTVTFSSDFLVFGATTARNLAFSFSSVTPSLTLGSGNFFQTLSAAVSGTFASNPPPTPFVPTAGGVSVSGRVLTASGQGVRNANVLLTESNGVTHSTRTGSFGTFVFDDIESGQNVVISIASKRSGYSPRFVSLFDNISTLEFLPD